MPVCRPSPPDPPRVSRPWAAGQATVELAVALPLLAVLLAACWQLVLAGNAAWSASAAARAAARAHALGGDALAAARAAAGKGASVEASDGSARVVVHVRVPAVVPGLDLGSVSSGATFASQR